MTESADAMLPGSITFAPSASNAVPGAAGAFGFDPVAGNPTGRDFPVLELTPGGALRLRGVYPLPAPAAGQ